MNNTLNGHHHVSINMLCLAGWRLNQSLGGQVFISSMGLFTFCFLCFYGLFFCFGLAATTVQSTKTMAVPCHYSKSIASADCSAVLFFPFSFFNFL